VRALDRMLMQKIQGRLYELKVRTEQERKSCWARLSQLDRPRGSGCLAQRCITSELSGKLPLRRISTMGTLPLYQRLHGIDERQAAKIDGQVNGATPAVLRARVVPLRSRGQNLKLSPLRTCVPASAG
jgi:hypothetical protein